MHHGAQASPRGCVLGGASAGDPIVRDRRGLEVQRTRLVEPDFHPLLTVPRAAREGQP